MELHKFLLHSMSEFCFLLFIGLSAKLTKTIITKVHGSHAANFLQTMLGHVTPNTVLLGCTNFCRPAASMNEVNWITALHWLWSWFCCQVGNRQVPWHLLQG